MSRFSLDINYLLPQGGYWRAKGLIVRMPVLLRRRGQTFSSG
jgi:hypothetical protein